MNNIADKAIVLKLNKHWRVIGHTTVGAAFTDLVAGNSLALNIDYILDNNNMPIYGNANNLIPTNWNNWINLPIRPYDLHINTVKHKIRIPTIIISKKYDKMPKKRFADIPSKNAIRLRDGNIDQYTGKLISNPKDMTIDHVIPKYKGGSHSWDNLVLTTTSTNNKKGNKLNHEAGLNLIRQPKKPNDIEIWETIKKLQHPDWKIFLPHAN